MTIDHRHEADRILAARRAFRTLDPISDRIDITMDDAYAIQALVTADRVRGDMSIGWKLGYTSTAMREQMGIAHPNFGPLSFGMLVQDGDDVAGRFIQPRVEPEIALRFADDIPVGTDRAGVLAAVEEARAALEIVDSVWTDYRFRIEDNTADGSSAAGVVIGPEIPLDRIADIGVTLFVDDVEHGSGVGSDASGHPADGVVWLADRLAERGLGIEAGDLVITGGLTSAPFLVEGSMVSAVFGGEAQVSVRRGRTPIGTVEP